MSGKERPGYYPRSTTVDDLGVVPKKPESPITLVVRRGALRRFDKLQKETANLPVVVQWDRRADDRQEPGESGEASPTAVDRRKQPSFTWELADFLVVPGEIAAEETPDADVTVAEAPESSAKDETPAHKAGRWR
jgi:hypothetical protein